MTQTALFAQDGTPTMEAARAARDQGMALALDKAEREHEGWSSIALNFLRKYAAENAEFPGYFVTMASGLDPEFPQPGNEKAWGSVWRKAAKLGIVRDSGKTMPHPKRHACKAIVWKSLLYRGEA